MRSSTNHAYHADAVTPLHAAVILLLFAVCCFQGELPMLACRKHMQRRTGDDADEGWATGVVGRDAPLALDL